MPRAFSLRRLLLSCSWSTWWTSVSHTTVRSSSQWSLAVLFPSWRLRTRTVTSATLVPTPIRTCAQSFFASSLPMRSTGKIVHYDDVAAAVHTPASVLGFVGDAVPQVRVHTLLYSMYSASHNFLQLLTPSRHFFSGSRYLPTPTLYCSVLCLETSVLSPQSSPRALLLLSSSSKGEQALSDV
jgi:hypothetical protein